MVQIGEDRLLVIEAAEANPQLLAFDALLLEKGEHPRRSDRYMGAYSIALREALHDSPELQTIYKEALSATDSNLHHLWQLSVRALIRQASDAQDQAIDAGLAHFPADYITPLRPGKAARRRTTDHWRNLIDWVTADPTRLETFADDITNHKVQTNKFQRYVAVEAALHIFKTYNRLPDEPSILDIGCAQNHGNKILTSAFLFYPVEASKRASPEAAAMAIWMDENLGVRIKKGRLDGVDLEPIDKYSFDKSLLDSFYLTERYEKPELIQDYIAVSRASPSNVHFTQADFAQPQMDDVVLNQLNPRGYDVAVMATVAHQLSPEQRLNMLQNAISQLKPEGFLIVQDFFKRVRDPKSPTGWAYNIVEDWDNKKGLYMTLIYDNAAPKMGFQPLFVWKNARCEELEDCNRNIEIALGLATADSQSLKHSRPA